MPYRIDADGNEFRDLPEFSKTAAQRRQRWEIADERHSRNRSTAPATLPPCLEVIFQKPGDAGILLAAARLLPFHEGGVPVISDSGLLFGARLLPSEVDRWDTIIRPGQAVCLTDKWFNRVYPQVANPNLQGTGDFLDSDSPQRAAQIQDSREWSVFIRDLEEKMEGVINGGCHVVLVVTSKVDVSEPDWLEMIDGPLVIVRTSGLSEKSLADEPYAVPDIDVDDRTGAGAFRNPPVPNSYHRPNRTALLDARLLVEVDGNKDRVGI